MVRTTKTILATITLSLLLPTTASVGLSGNADKASPEFHSDWFKNAERIWIGPEYWANRLQDWRISAGRLECVRSGSDRNVHLLTRQLGDGGGDFDMSVRLGALDSATAKSPGWAGFRVGAIGQWKDHRDSCRRGVGIDVGLTTDGTLFIGKLPARPAAGLPPRDDYNPPAQTVTLALDVPQAAPAGAAKANGPALAISDVELRLTARPSGKDYTLTLSAHDPVEGKELAKIARDIPAERLVGNVAIVCHSPQGGKSRQGRKPSPGGKVRFWFRDWKLAGQKFEAHDEHAFGPVLWAQYTLSRGVMKMTAQMPPMGQADSNVVRLEIRKQPAGPWTQIATAKIHPDARTATFRIPDWNDKQDIPYRAVYSLIGADGKQADHYWTGTVRRDPVDKPCIVVAAFTGNADYAFPDLQLNKHVLLHNPDLLFFSGDNIYENTGGFGLVRKPVDEAILGYLRKWYYFGWSHRELFRDRPCISIPDDHDVYQGNLWGQGGRKCPGGINTGGYSMDPRWVKVVEQTQTSSLPDPYDPTPVEQGIGVYYTELLWGRVSFAVLEDRKFKTGPEGVVPPTKGRSDHVRDPNFDPRTADVPGAKLLGDRQLKFLADWSGDWRGADFKCALSQTVFANVATLHGGGLMRLIADYDSNGWPQAGRNRALAAIRKAFGFMIGGDQHLATLVHHGIDDFNDAGWSMCTPSVVNFYPRAWVPLKPAHNFKPGMIEHTGEFLDGFGNRVTVYAHANPRPMHHEPAGIHDKMPGYGIVRFHKPSRKIDVECWPLFANPKDPKTGGQYEGWPRTITQLDNYGKTPQAWLPTIQVEGMDNPVIQIIDQADGQMLYTLRIPGRSFQPWTFKKGAYTIKVGELGTSKVQTLKNIQATKDKSTKPIKVKF